MYDDESAQVTWNQDSVLPGYHILDHIALSSLADTMRLLLLLPLVLPLLFTMRPYSREIHVLC